MFKYIKFIFAFFICFLIESIAELTALNCRELGFIRPQLLCETCDKFDEFGLEIIKPQCVECCTVNTNTQKIDKRYPKAILEVCTCKFRAYPQIEAFIKSGGPAKFQNLQIKYVRGLDPAIKLLDSKDNVQETLSITKWNTATVEEFFETHLQKYGGSKDAFSLIEDDEEIDAEDYLNTNAI